jgi:chromosome segregation ATPase
MPVQVLTPDGASSRKSDSSAIEHTSASGTDTPLIVPGELPPPTPPAEAKFFADASCAAELGKSEAEWQKEIADMNVHLKLMMSRAQASARSEQELRHLVEQMQDSHEQLQNTRDDLMQELDSLRKVLETKERENQLMRNKLEELGFSVEGLASEASGLRNTNAQLKATAEQQEYTDMAAMEILVKSEDMNDVEKDLRYMSGIHDDDEFMRMRRRNLEVLGELSGFLNNLMRNLSAQRFNTGTLESRRLNLLNDATVLMDRCEEARALLNYKSET